MAGNAHDGSVDLREVGLALRHGWWIIAVGAVLGTGAGIAVNAFMPERYEGVAKVLVRASPDLASSALSRLGGIGEMIGGMGGAASELNTELEILASRPVVGEVVDSLLLEAQVRSPAGVAANELFERVRVAPSTRTRRYSFERAGDGRYRVSGEGVVETVGAGEAARLPGVELTLRRGAELPAEFVVDMLDRDDAIGAVQKGLRTRTLTNDIAEITFRGRDPVTAAAVPNLLVGEYLQRRRSTDRGTNQTRYEFLVAHTDSVTMELAGAEAALREYQELSGVIDPRLVGEAQLMRAMELQGELETIEIEARALQRIVDADREGRISPRELAAYPSFLRNAAINDVLSRLLGLETERVELLQRRTETDPDVLGLAEAITHLEAQLRSLSSAYLSGLDRQRGETVSELGQYRGVLDRLPSQAEENLRRQREVERLSQIQLVLHSQLVQTRLAAIGEGGEVQQIETATAPKTPAFPSAAFVLLAGLFGGLFFGTVGAVSNGLMRQRVREPWEAELATGVRATAFATNGPLTFPEVRTARTILLLPLGTVREARQVGEQIVETAAVQGREAVLADLTDGGGVPVAPSVPAVAGVAEGAGSSMVVDLPTGAVRLPLYRGGGGEFARQQRAMLAHLEERFPLVVAVVAGIDEPATLSIVTPDRPVVLVAGSSEVTREELRRSVQAVERFGGTVAGVVLRPPASRKHG